MFEDANDIETLARMRADLLKNASESEINAINSEFQMRKKFISDNKNIGFILEETKINKIIECDGGKTGGAVFENGKLVITVPDFAYAVDGSEKIDKSIYPKDANTFALYIFDKEEIPMFVIT